MRKLLALGLGLVTAIILSSCGGGGDSGSTTPTKPSISILYLDNTPLVATPLPIQTSANSLVKKYQFFLDNTPLGNPGVATEIIINTSTIPDGIHTIRVRGIAADNTFAEDSKTFLVDKAEIRRQALAYLNQALPRRYDSNGNQLPIVICRWPTTNITIIVVPQYFDIAKETFNAFNKYCGLNLTAELDTTFPSNISIPGKAVIGTNVNFEGLVISKEGEINTAYMAVRNTPHFSVQFLVAQAIANILNFNLFPVQQKDLNLFTINRPIPYLPFYVAEGLYVMYHEIPPGGLIPAQ